MHRILIDNARRKLSGKHGGGLVHGRRTQRFPVANPRDPLEVMAVHEALDRLAQKSPRKAELVKLRYFLGCTMAEAAQILGIAPATAEEDWTYAKAWLRRQCAPGRGKKFAGLKKVTGVLLSVLALDDETTIQPKENTMSDICDLQSRRQIVSRASRGVSSTRPAAPSRAASRNRITAACP